MTRGPWDQGPKHRLPVHHGLRPRLVEKTMHGCRWLVSLPIHAHGSIHVLPARPPNGTLISWITYRSQFEVHQATSPGFVGLAVAHCALERLGGVAHGNRIPASRVPSVAICPFCRSLFDPSLVVLPADDSIATPFAPIVSANSPTRSILPATIVLWTDLLVLFSPL